MRKKFVSTKRLISPWCCFYQPTRTSGSWCAVCVCIRNLRVVPHMQLGAAGRTANFNTSTHARNIIGVKIPLCCRHINNGKGHRGLCNCCILIKDIALDHITSLSFHPIETNKRVLHLSGRTRRTNRIYYSSCNKIWVVGTRKSREASLFLPPKSKHTKERCVCFELTKTSWLRNKS